MTGDIAAQMVEGIDRFLLREIDHAAKSRERYWSATSPRWRRTGSRSRDNRRGERMT
ncbi:MAG: hypothetical protein U0797_02865 [Gemmataceae bacterium]